MTDESPEGPEILRPRMTLRVYTVDRYGTVTAKGAEIAVMGTEPPPLLGGPLTWPPCRCTRCAAHPPRPGTRRSDAAHCQGGGPDGGR